MILTINSNNHPRLDEVYALRACILHDRWHWPVTVVGGKEVDDLDDVPPTHMLYLVDDELKGYLRLLPTTGPTMQQRYFSDVFKTQPTAPDIWEVSKYVFSEDVLDAMYFTKAKHRAIMFAGLGKFCWRNNIKSIIGIIDERTLSTYSNGGITVDIIEKAKIGDQTMYNISRSMEHSILLKTAEWFEKLGIDILEQSELMSA